MKKKDKEIIKFAKQKEMKKHCKCCDVEIDAKYKFCSIECYAEYNGVKLPKPY